MRRAKTVIAVALLAPGILSGCGGTSSSAPSATVPPTQPSAIAAPTAQALRLGSADLTMAGDPGLAGKLTSSQIQCGLPSLDGATIVVVAQGTDPSVHVKVSVLPSAVTVAVAVRSAAGYRGRTFAGPGVSGFDIATGTRIDSSLTQTAEQSLSPGDVGIVASIAGKIDCGHQPTGTSTITFTGDTAEGPVRGSLNTVFVECLPTNAVILGLTRAGTSTMLVGMNIKASAATFYTQTRTTGEQFVQHEYASPVGTATYTAPTANVEGNAAEIVAAGATAHTLHIVGEVSCPRTS